MISVLFITANPNRASSNVPTENWFRILGKDGLHPVVVTNREGAFCNWTRSQNIKTHLIPLPVPDRRRPWNYFFAIWAIRKIIRRERVHLIHAIEQNVCPFAVDVARWCRLPVVVGIHCRVRRPFVEWALGGRRVPDRLLFLSEGSRDVCRPAVEGIIPESKWGFLPNGLDLRAFCPDAAAGARFRDEHRLGRELLVGIASWLRPGKQLEHAVKVMSDPQLRHATFVLAGGIAPGEEAYANQFLEHARNALRERFRFLGCLNDVRNFYNAIDICLNTSREESCSISIMESLACGCPVIGYPSVSVREQVLPDGGEITPQDDIESLIAGIARWISDRCKLADARLLARQQAVRFDIAALSQSLWCEYEALLSKHAGKRRSPLTAL